MAATAEAPIDPTRLCLLVVQGHQHFLDRLTGVPAHVAPPPRGRGRSAITLTAAQSLAEALFEPWHRSDPTFSFRCDPEEDLRYVLMVGNPTDAAYKSGTQHAAIGLSILTVVLEVRAGRVRAAIVGGHWDGKGFSLAWPLWRPPASLAAIRNMLSDPDLRRTEQFAAMDIAGVMLARRISVGKFMDFSRVDFIAGGDRGQ